MNHILSLDQGTSSSRAIVFQKDGTIAAMAQKEFTQHYPKPGWVEHDPIEIWDTQLQVAHDALKQANCTPESLAAIGITNQRETTVIWNRLSGKPIHPAIVWQDRRTTDLCHSLREAGAEKTFQQKTGLLLDPYFSGTKIRWLLDNVEGARAQAEKGELAFGTIDSWLVWNLTQGACYLTDVSNASRTLLFNIHTLEWDTELLELLNIPQSILPEVRSSSEVYGQATAIDSFEKTPISGIAGDQQAALFGQTCFTEGTAKNTYGTGCFLLMNIGETPVLSNNKLLTTVAWKLGNKTTYALEGSVFVAGAVIQWLRDELKIIQSASETEAIAQSVEDNGSVYFVPAFTGLGAPHWDPFARGTITGLTRGTHSAHIVRAALESIAFQSRDLIDTMKADAQTPLKELRVDGGASLNNFLMQFQADILNISVVRPKVAETTALGTAYLAGLAVGFWESQEAIAQQWSIDKTYTPQSDSNTIEQLDSHWQRALERSKNWSQ